MYRNTKYHQQEQHPLVGENQGVDVDVKKKYKPSARVRLMKSIRTVLVVMMSTATTCLLITSVIDYLGLHRNGKPLDVSTSATLSSLVPKLQYYNEWYTHNIRLLVLTGNQQWWDRYAQFGDEYRELKTQIKRMVSVDVYNQFKLDVVDVDDVVGDIEEDAANLAMSSGYMNDQTKKQQAYALVLGDIYEHNKSTWNGGIAKLSEYIKKTITRQHNQDNG